LNNKYTDEHFSFIRERSPTMTDKDLHDLFCRTFKKDINFAAFRKLRQRLGIRKKNGRPQKR